MRHFLLVAIFITSAIAAAHNWDAKDYHAHSASQKHAADRLLANENLDKSAHLLDVGCGDGKITSKLAEQLFEGKVVGLDISPTMIDFARKTFSTHWLEFVVGDASKIDFHEQFDYITSFSAMQWVRDQKAALAGMHAALKPGGRLLITMPRHYPECLSNALIDLIGQAPYNTRFTGFASGQIFFGVEEYRKLLEGVGFNNIAVAFVDGHDRFPNLAAFTNFVKQWLPWAQVFSDPTEKDLFMTQLMDRYVAYCPAAADGSIVFLKQQLEATATKSITP
jgi:trans-aconitate methyltransferase